MTATQKSQSTAAPKPPGTKRAQDPYGHIKDCHMGGKPVTEVVDPKMAHLITFAHTDEGIQATNAKKNTGGPQVEMVRSEFDGQVRQFGDFRKDHPLDMGSASDPMLELADKYAKPGMRPKFLSDEVVRTRGMRGYEPVVDDKGNPVKLAGMTLAHIPEEMARERQEASEEKGRKRLETVRTETYQELYGDAKRRPTVRPPDAREDGVLDGLQDD